jgi:hypothetical protein
LRDELSPTALGLSLDLVEPGSAEAIYIEAYQKAETAQTYKYVEFGGDPAFCGSAWLVVRPARGSFVKFCKRHGIGESGVYGGWEISSPGSYHGQSMDIKEAGCEAFVAVLREHGLKAFAKSRAD